MSAATEALIRRNALACEHAKKSECCCLCGGAFHGLAHSEATIARMVQTQERLEGLRRRADLEAAGQIDWCGTPTKGGHHELA